MKTKKKKARNEDCKRPIQGQQPNQTRQQVRKAQHTSEKTRQKQGKKNKVGRLNQNQHQEKTTLDKHNDKTQRQKKYARV